MGNSWDALELEAEVLWKNLLVALAGSSSRTSFDAMWPARSRCLPCRGQNAGPQPAGVVLDPSLSVMSVDGVGAFDLFRRQAIVQGVPAWAGLHVRVFSDDSSAPHRVTQAE